MNDFKMSGDLLILSDHQKVRKNVFLNVFKVPFEHF